jgi:hypothetical protein
VRLIGQDGDGGAAEIVATDRAADLLEVADRALEQRDLDAVVAGGPQFLEQREVRVGDVRRPQEEIEPGLHAPRSLPAACAARQARAASRALACEL